MGTECETVLSYRGRAIVAADVECVRALIAAHPTASRRRLSLLLCEAWNWRQRNGVLRDMVARGLLLELQRAGLVELPSSRWQPGRTLVAHRRPEPAPLLTWPPLERPLQELRPLEWRQVRRTADETRFDVLLETHHYLGYTQPVGEHLKYLVFSCETPVACLAFSSAPRHLGARDRFVGWTAPVRRRNIAGVVYNTRFLVLPWAHVPHLASHVLAKTLARLSADWIRLYHHPVHLVETFIDPERFRGTCYRAAGWQFLGVTTGRGKDAPTRTPNRSIKELWAYPLSRDFRERLCAVPEGS